MLSHGVKIVKIGPVDPEIFDKIRQFFCRVVPEPDVQKWLCQLWSCWTKLHEIFVRYTAVICAVNAHIEVA